MPKASFSAPSSRCSAVGRASGAATSLDAAAASARARSSAESRERWGAAASPVSAPTSFHFLMTFAGRGASPGTSPSGPSAPEERVTCQPFSVRVASSRPRSRSDVTNWPRLWKHVLLSCVIGRSFSGAARSGHAARPPPARSPGASATASAARSRVRRCSWPGRGCTPNGASSGRRRACWRGT
eukprot:4000590-Prymnesium_polylepis.1